MTMNTVVVQNLILLGIVLVSSWTGASHASTSSHQKLVTSEIQMTNTSTETSKESLPLEEVESVNNANSYLANKALEKKVKRTIGFPGSELEFGGRNVPFCYDRYVTGNCRYRTDPAYCFQYEWTAYAIVQNYGGGIESEPVGLFVEPGNQERVRVWIKTSCCTSFVKVISIDPYSRNVNECVIDIRELQGLHPGEIAGIVLGCLVILILVIIAIILLIRKRNTGVATVENDCQVKSYGFNMRPTTGGGTSTQAHRVK